MQVGLLIYGSLDSLSGGYLYDRTLVKHLIQQGEKVEVISLPWRNYSTHIFDNLKSTFRDKLRNLEVDVLIQDELNHPSLFFLNQKLTVPYPILSLVHHLRCNEMHPAWQNLIYRHIERRYLDSVDGFIFNSQTTCDSVDQISPIKNRPWLIATPGGDRFNPRINAHEIKERVYQPGALRLVFLGNLIPRKGLLTLIDALSLLDKDSFKLDVLGPTQIDPAYTKTIQTQIDRYDLKSLIQFHGVKDDHELGKLLRDRHVMIVPSSYEGFGIAYLEGMGYGLPAISTTHGAASEIINHGECGYLIEPGDAKALARFLMDLHQDRFLLGDLSLAAHNRYKQFPGWQDSMAKIHSFLIKIAGY